jgi:hypothetical protein
MAAWFRWRDGVEVREGTIRIENCVSSSGEHGQHTDCFTVGSRPQLMYEATGRDRFVLEMLTRPELVEAHFTDEEEDEFTEALVKLLDEEPRAWQIGGGRALHTGRRFEINLSQERHLGYRFWVAAIALTQDGETHTLSDGQKVTRQRIFRPTPFQRGNSKKLAEAVHRARHACGETSAVVEAFRKAITEPAEPKVEKADEPAGAVLAHLFGA